MFPTLEINKCMDHETNERVIYELIHQLEEKRQHLFPYAGCRKLLRESDNSYENLIPDLDIYFSGISLAIVVGGKDTGVAKRKVARGKRATGENIF